MKKYLAGELLYGDDFDDREIEQWYNEEKEAYAELQSKEKYVYAYHESNRLNGFEHIKSEHFENVLGFGSAYGEELQPVLHKIKNITIIEPSDQLVSEKIGNIVPHYQKPEISGKLTFADSTFDLVTCFGVLHHIPNVTTVINELIRVTKPGGYLLIKEPINTMGDWTEKRHGLTKNERGIPEKYFEKIFNGKVDIVKKTYIDTLSVYKILKKFFNLDFDSKKYTKIDRIVSKFLSWNSTYHRTGNFRKLAPAGIFYVLIKK